MGDTADESRLSAIEGCLLGTAIGDALGLPWEGLSRGRIARKCGEGPLRYRFLLGRGMVTDDTEHAIVVGQALLRASDESADFQKALAQGLRLWFLGLPAGIGLSTLKSCLKLWSGIPPARSGVMSAGNGASMRAPLIGVYFAHDLEKLLEFCDASSVITHRDDRAVTGARIVAIAARNASLMHSAQDFFEIAEHHCTTCGPWLEMVAAMRNSFHQSKSVEEFSNAIGCGDRVTGFVMQSVPVAVYSWLMHRNDYRRAIESVIRLGGDTDTTGAIAGALCGASRASIPSDLIEGLWEWPRGVDWMRRLAANLANGKVALPVAWPLIAPRNAIFTATVLCHGFRRLLP